MINLANGHIYLTNAGRLLFGSLGDFNYELANFIDPDTNSLKRFARL